MEAQVKLRKCDERVGGGRRIGTPYPLGSGNRYTGWAEEEEVDRKEGVGRGNWTNKVKWDAEKEKEGREKLWRLARSPVTESSFILIVKISLANRFFHFIFYVTDWRTNGRRIGERSDRRSDACTPRKTEGAWSPRLLTYSNRKKEYSNRKKKKNFHRTQKRTKDEKKKQ